MVGKKSAFNGHGRFSECFSFVVGYSDIDHRRAFAFGVPRGVYPPRRAYRDASSSVRTALESPLVVTYDAGRGKGFAVVFRRRHDHLADISFEHLSPDYEYRA